MSTPFTLAGKTFIPAPPDANCECNLCPYMKLNTTEKLFLCMRDRAPEIVLDDDIIARAQVPIRRMLELTSHEPPPSISNREHDAQRQL